jgi:hypothetical protein
VSKSRLRRDAADKVKGISLRIFLLLFLFVSFKSFATTKTSTGSGNWGDAATWSPSGVPAASDDVIITGGDNITVNISNAVCLSLQIGDVNKANATVTFNSGAQLTVTGTVTFGGNGNALRNGAVDMTFGGKLICTDFLVQNFSSFTSGEGTVEFTGSSTLPSDFTDFNNLIINGAGTTVTLGSDLIVTGTLTLTSGILAAGSNLSMGSNSAISRSGGVLTGRLQGTNYYDLIYTGDTKTMGPERTGYGLRNITANLNSGQTVTQDTVLSVTSLTVSAGTYTTSTYALTLSGNLAVNGTLAGSGNITLTGSVTTISGTGSVSNTGTFGVNTGNKTISAGSTLTFAGTIAITGGVTIDNYGSVTSTASTGITGTTIGSSWRNNTNSSLTIAGPLLTTGNLIAIASPNTITYNSTSAGQTINGTTYHHLVVNKSGQTATLGGNTTVNGDLTISAGTLDVSASNYSLTLKGNFTNSGTFTRRSGTVTFSGTATQAITGTLTFNNLTVNTSGGITLANDITVAGTLTLTSGKITTGSSYKVIIASTGSVSGGSSSSFVAGKLQKNVATGSNVARTFEVGVGTSYLPVTLTFSTVTVAGDITAVTTTGDHPQLSSSCISSSGSLNKYWTISNSGVVTLSYTAAFGFSASDLDAGASPSELRIANYASSTWTNLTVSNRTSTSTTASGITATGDFAVGEYNPKISSQPSSVTACATDNVTYALTATGSGLSYQWQESTNSGSSWSGISNGGVYGGATTASLTLSGVTAGMSGYQYRCIVSNTGGCSNTDTSNTVSLTIASSFTINTQPSSSSVCSASPASFSVVASGAVSGYQWQVNTGSGWSNISNSSTYSGATTATLAIASAGGSMNGYQYRCAISSNCGPGQNTNAATLTILTAPSISANPSNVSSCEASNVNFSVTASGSSITYQWQESSNGTTWSDITNGGNYSGATSATLTISSIPYSLTGYQYRCVVSGSCTPPAVSTAATVTLSARPDVTSDPASVTVQYNTNRNASFSVAATGAGTLSYQWQESTNGGTSWSNISNGGVYSGATTTTLSLTNATIGMDNYKYRCYVSGSCSPADTSASATLYISFSFTVISNTNWSALSPTPTSTSTIEVKNGATLTVDVSNAVCATMQLGRKPNPNGGSGTLAFNSGSQLSVLGPGRNVIFGDQNQSGSINMTNGGTLICNGFIVDAIGTWTPGTGTVEFTGIQTIPSNFTSFNNLTANSLLVTLGGNTTLTGSLNITTGSTLNTSTYTLSVPGDLTVNGTLSGTGAITMTGANKQISGIGTVNNTNTFTLSTGDKTIASGTAISFSGTIAISGAITVTNNGSITTTASGGITGSASGSTWVNGANATLTISGSLLSTGTLTATTTGNTISYASLSAAQTVKAGTYYNLTIEKTSQTGTLAGATTVNGTLDLEHGTLAAGTNLTMGSGSMVQVNSGSMTGTIQGSNSYDVKYTNNSKTTSSELSGSGLRNFTVEMVTGEVLYLDRNLSPSGNITITSGTLDVSASNFDITAKSNFTNNGTFVPRSGTITFSGTSAETISGTATTDFYGLIINNSAGATISGAVNLQDSLTLLSGTLAAGTYLTPGSGSSITVNAGSLTGTLQGANSYDVFYTGNSKTTSGAVTGTGLRDVYLQLTSGQTLTLGAAMTINRDLKLTTGTLDVSTSNYALNIGRNFTNTGTFTARSGKVTLNGATAQTVSGATTFYRLTVNNSSTGVTLSSAVTVGDTLRLQQGLLAAGSNLTMASGTNIRVQKGTMSGTLQGSNAYNVIYTDSSKTTTSGLSGAGLQDVIVALDANRTVTLGSAFSASRDVIITSGTLDVSSNNYGITVKRNFANSGTFTARSGTVTFSGTSAQTISGSGATTFYNLTVNNSTGLSLSSVNATIGNTLTLTSGTLAVGTNTLTLNGAVSITSGALSSSATGTINYNQASNGQSVIAMDYGNLTFSNFNKTLASSGNIRIAGTFTAGSATGHTVTGSTIVFNGSSAQTVPAFTFNNLTLSNSSGGSLSGNVTVGSTLTLSSGTLAVGANTLTLNGSVSVTSGALTSGTTGTVNYNQSSSGQSILAIDYGNLTFSNFDKILPSSGTVGINGTFTPGSSTNHTVTGSTVDFKGASQNIPAFTFNNLTISGSGTKTLTGAVTANGNLTISAGTFDLSASNYALAIKGNFTNNATFTGRSSTVTFSGASAQTISGSSAPTFYNLTLNNSSGLSLSSVNATIGNTLTLTSGTFAIGTNTLTLNGAVSVSSGALSSSTTGTVIYNQSSNGQVVIAMDYGNLTFSDYNKTLPSSGTVGIAGIFTTGAATGHTITGSTVDFKGTGAQNIVAFTFNNLSISGGSTKTLTGNITVNGTLTFNSGLISTGSYKVAIANGGSVSGAGSGKYVYGNLQKNVSTGSSVARTFEVGNASNYLPVSLTFNTVGTAGDITVNTTDGDHAQIGTSCLNSSKSVNRYWTVSNSGTVFTSYTATVNFVSGDIDAGASTSNFRIAVYNNGWSNPTTGTRTSTSTSASGITTVGVLQAGEPTSTVISSQPVSSTICVGGNTSFSVSATGSGLTYQWQESTNSGSSWGNVNNGGVYSGATSATLLFTNPLTSMAGYMYRCIISASCVPNDTTNAVILTVNISGLWLGLTSSWTSSANWCGGVPTSSTNVTIPATAPNMPTTSGAITINNLTIQSGATLTLGGNLTVNGDFANSGTLTVGANTLDLKGGYSGSGTLTGGSSSNLTISGSASAITLPGASFNNVTINRSSGVSMGGNLIISGTLTLTSGTFSVGNYRLTLNGNAIAGTTSNLSTTSGSALIIGGSASSLSLPTSVTALKTLVLNNSNGVGLSAGLTITDSLVFQSGTLSIDNYNLTIGNSGVVTGYDSTKYIITKNNMGSGGTLSRYVANNDAFVIFPVGTATSYSPAKIKLTVGSTADNFTVRVVNNMYAAGTSGTQLTENILNRTWLIEEATVGGSDATVNLGWVPAMEGSNFNHDNVAVTHYTSGQWNHNTSFGTYATVENMRWRAGSGYTSFSPFSVVDGDMAMNVPLTLKAYFECCYESQMDGMETDLNALGYIPLSQPYNTSPWNYSGTESVGSIPNSNVVDWVLVKLRDASSASQATNGTEYARKAGFILANGSIVETDGVTPITFSIKPSGNYYVVIYHRNHLAIMSANALTYSSGNYTFDLTNSNNVYGGTAGMSLIGYGVYGMTSGMVDQSNEVVDSSDLNAAWNNKNKSGGYYLWDCTLDGNVDAADRTMIFNNQSKQTQVP